MYDWNWINKYMNPKENLKRDPFHKDISSFLPPMEQWEVIRDQRFPEKSDKRAEQKFEGDGTKSRADEPRRGDGAQGAARPSPSDTPSTIYEV